MPTVGLWEMCGLLYSQGLLGKLFVVATIVGAASIAYVDFRDVSKRINAEAFLAQIGKLVAAGNVDRALKLSSVAGEGPVARLVRVGLRAWQAGGDGVGDEQRFVSALGAIQRERKTELGRALRGFNVARALAVVACLPAFLLLANAGPARPLLFGCIAVIALLLLWSGAIERRIRSEVARVPRGLANRP